MAFAACGPTATPSDPTPDASPDVAPDVPDDVTPDAATDASREASVDAPSLDVARDTTAPPDLGTDARADAPAADVACSGTAPSCVAGMAGGQCSDALTVARCEGGAWRCGAGEVFTSQCACLGRPLPGCTCGPSGWVCPDAGTDATGMDVACSGSAPSCVAGTAGGQCSDALTVARCEGGAWRCGAGEVLTSQCACIGRPPGVCTCTPSGWSCGTDAGAVDAALECTGRPASCVSGTAGGACGDVVTAPTCVRGAWTCPAGQVFITQCACTGRPPASSCTCTPSGWSCPDAGTDAGTAGTLCGRDSDCASGLLCCYPCGIPGCMNRCMAPMGGRCPLIP
ncbi:MAG: hypothetical protein U0324_19560 [Polyangiales bacterium]